MVAFRKLLLFAIGTSAAVLRRDAGSFRQRVTTLVGDYAALAATTQAWNGYGTFTFLAVFGPINRSIQDDYTNATGDINNYHSKFSDMESRQMVDLLTKNLEPNVRAALNTYQSQKNNLTTSNLKSAIYDTLKDYQSRHGELAYLAVLRFPDSQRQAASDILGKIYNEFGPVIASFT